MNTLLKDAERLREKYVKLRRKLHANAETGFDLSATLTLVCDTLTALGIEYKPVGKSSVLATLGGGRYEANSGALLLRADMDALKMQEKSGESFACKRGNMHACGHDIHTAALLCAAELLNEREHALQREVKLLFQAAEESLEGAKAAVESGVCDGVERAAMLHVLTGLEIPTGTLIISSEGFSAPAADYFTLIIKGKACHGASPQNGVDALTVAARVLLGLQELSAREVSGSEPFVLTVGKLYGGTAGNAVCDSVEMQGTLRCFDELLRVRVKRRIAQIAEHTAKAYRAKATVTYGGGCPALYNDKKVSEYAYESLKSVFGANAVTYSQALGQTTKKGLGGSEDFAYIAQKTPSVMIGLAAGNKEEGYAYPLHNPKTRFDERAVSIGAAAYAALALGWGTREK